jgi:hypothetical protein
MNKKKTNRTRIEPKKGHKVVLYIAALAGIFAGGWSLIQDHGYTDKLGAYLAVISLLYGIFLAFSIYNQHGRLALVNEMLKQHEGNLYSLYVQSAVFGIHAQDRMRVLIDEYLVAELDYRLDDFNLTTPEFRKIYDYVLSFEPKGEKQSVVFEIMLGCLSESSQLRKQVETSVRQRMTKLEWFSISALLGLLSYTMAIISDVSISGMVIVFVTVLTAIILMVVLWQLDTLKWQAERWIWQPLHDLFVSMDLLPYYPEPAIRSGEVHVKKGEDIRVAYYNNPYPDITDKEVRVTKAT